MDFAIYRTRPLANVQTEFTSTSLIVDVSDRQCTLNDTSYAW